MTQESFRPLSDYEKAVLERLFEVDFSGRSELKEQALDAQGSLIRGTNDNYGSINIRTSSDRRADVKDRVPVIGMTKDEGGGHVEILLHVIDGKINELEFVRMDGDRWLDDPIGHMQFTCPRRQRWWTGKLSGINQGRDKNQTIGRPNDPDQLATIRKAPR